MTADVRTLGTQNGNARRFPRRMTFEDWGIFVLLGFAVVVAATVVGLDGGTLNARNMAIRSVGLGLVASGQTAVIITGRIDLSVSFLITLTALVGAAVSNGDPARLPITIVAVIAVGAVVGLVNGVVVAKLKVNAFIATLAMALVLKGIIASRYASTSPGPMPDNLVQTLGFGDIGGIPWSVVLLAAGAVVMGWILSRTRLGSAIYALGGGDDVARLSGIRADRALIAVHTISGIYAAIAGLYLASRLGTPNVEIGTNGIYDLESVAVVVLGGAALLGGRGRVSSTMAAIAVFALLDTTFNQLQVDPFLKLVVRGVIIIAAVASYSLRSAEEAE